MPRSPHADVGDQHQIASFSGIPGRVALRRNKAVFAGPAIGVATPLRAVITRRAKVNRPQAGGYKIVWQSSFTAVALPDRTRRTNDKQRGYAGRSVGCSSP